MFLYRLLLSFLFVASLIMSAEAEELFGPSSYEASWFGFSWDQVSFSAPRAGEGIIHLEKTTPNKTYLSGSISFNETRISISDFLHSDNTTLDLPVTLATSNRMSGSMFALSRATLLVGVTGNFGPEIDFVAQPATIYVGDGAILTWDCPEAENVIISPGIGSQPMTVTGNATVFPNSTTNYTLSATNAEGTSTASATVTLVPLKVTILQPVDLATVSTTIAVHGLLATKATYSNVAVNGRRAAVQDNEFFINDLKLQPGNNEIKVQAADSDQNLASSTITVFAENVESTISITLDDPIAIAPFTTSLRATLHNLEPAADSAMVTCTGPGEVESSKINDREFSLTFNTPGLYIVTYFLTDSSGVPYEAETRINIKPPFTVEDGQAMQVAVADLEGIYHNQLANNDDIATVREQVLAAARVNPVFSSATLSGGAVCLVYKDLIPIILDLPDPDGPVTDGSSAIIKHGTSPKMRK